MTHQPTPEQQAILSAGATTRDSLMVTAYAGCAKTSTLEMLGQVLPKTPTMALAFNVKIKDEMTKRLPQHVDCRTMNGLGHMAFGRGIGKRLELDNKKLGNLVSALFKERQIKTMEGEWESVITLVRLAQQAQFAPEGYSAPASGITLEAWASLADDNFLPMKEELVWAARETLWRSVKQAFSGVISFDDQIYMSAVFSGAFPSMDTLLVDEAQDLSPLNHLQLRRCAPKRLIVVGDPKQAIYAFRGADTRSMGSIRGILPTWQDLPLTTTFRCPHLVVGRNRHHAPGFNAFPTNKQGTLHQWQGQPWSWDKLRGVSKGEPVVLCRNNAPLLALCFKLLRQGIGAVILGRDIGKGLATILKKIAPQNLPMASLLPAIQQWGDNERAKAELAGHDEKVAGIVDRQESLLAIAQGSAATDRDSMLSTISLIFSREHGAVTLSTGHRAKGLEWETVVHLDPWRVPSRQAKKREANGDPSQMEQERNLLYVIETRTKDVLVLANLEDLE